MFIFCVSLPATRLLLPAFTSVHIIPGVRNASSLVPRSNFDSPILALCPPAGGGFSAAVALSVVSHRRPVTQGIEVNVKEVERGVRNRPRSGTGIGGGKRRTTSEHNKWNITSTHPRDRAVCDQVHGTNLTHSLLTFCQQLSARSRSSNSNMTCIAFVWVRLGS